MPCAIISKPQVKGASLMRKNLKLAALAAAISLSMTAGAAHAQGVPVVDPSNIAQTVKVVQNGVQQVQQMKQQVEQMTQMKNTIGAMGVGEIGSILQRANLNIDNNNNLLGEFRQTVPGIIDALPNSNVGRELGVDAGAARQARTSIDAARRFTISTFYGGSNAGIDEVNKRGAIREAALRDSASSGFAQAVVAKARLTESEATIKALNEQMSASTDLRTDVQNNTAVAMAQYQQLIIQTQLIAQLLEVQATGNMAVEVAPR